MNRAWRSLLVFAVLAVVLDRGLGFGLAGLERRARTKEVGHGIAGGLATKAQVLLLGSSRMIHHVDPAVLSRRLSLSVYNAGRDGQDFLYAAMLVDLRRHSNPPPRVIVLHVDPKSFTKDAGELKRSNCFSFYLDESDLVRKVIYQRSALEPLKYLSSAYRANGKVLPTLMAAIVGRRGNTDGFEPLPGTMAPPPAHDAQPVQPRWEPIQVWDFKAECFKGLAAYCRRNAIRLVLLHTPEFTSSARFAEAQRGHDAWVTQVKAFLADYPDIEFFDISEFTQPQTFRDPKLFADPWHLNAKGAEVLSELVATAMEVWLNGRPAVSN